MTRFDDSLREIPTGVAGVYAIICCESDSPENRLYVGESANVSRRLWQHVGQLRNGNHHSAPLQNAYNKYGENAFVCVFLEEADDAKQRFALERYYWTELRACLNTAPPDGQGSCEWTDERRQQNGERSRALWADKEKLARKNEKVRAAWTDEKRAQRSKSARRIQTNPDVKRRQREGICSALARPDIKQRQCDGIRAAWSRPEMRERRHRALDAYHQSTDLEKYAVSPDGVIHHVRNYSIFARAQALCPRHLSDLFTGRRKTHRGWRAATEIEIATARRREAETRELCKLGEK